MGRTTSVTRNCKRCGYGFVSAVKHYGLCKKCYKEFKEARYIARPVAKPDYGFHKGLFQPDQFGMVRDDYSIERGGGYGTR